MESHVENKCKEEKKPLFIYDQLNSFEEANLYDIWHWILQQFFQ